MKFAAIGIALLTTHLAVPLYAAAPMARTSAPGFSRFMLGDFEITSLSDGTLDFPMDQLLAQPADETKKTLNDAFLKLPLETSVNTFLINTGKSLILIDAGAGNIFGPTAGKVVESLQASGYTPEQIDEIYLTHAHPDHLGGLSKDGKAVFPNAILRVDARDSEFWLSKKNLEAAPKDNKPFFEAAVAAIGPYQAAKKFKDFKGDAELSPGIRPLSTVGHTAGHSCFEITSKGQKLVLIGDLIHVERVQMPKPDVTIAFDSDAKAAAKARKDFFDKLVKDGTLVGASHLSFPGVGHLRRQDAGYSWIAKNYSRMN
ncbi:MAG: MBL fold metallo-hydrolase [Proteobacteria bacterium]|nr:MAG: MBL fold metallo-hydrolase [Pseudomonadota bacterium]